MVCFCVSGGVIAAALFPALREKKAGLCLLALLLAAHLGLSCGFMLVFFHAAPNNNSTIDGDTKRDHSHLTSASSLDFFTPSLPVILPLAHSHNISVQSSACKVPSCGCHMSMVS